MKVNDRLRHPIRHDSEVSGAVLHPHIGNLVHHDVETMRKPAANRRLPGTSGSIRRGNVVAVYDYLVDYLGKQQGRILGIGIHD